MRHLGDDDWSDLTENQEKILAFIENRSANGLPPPTKAAHENLLTLEKKGYIKLIRGISRGITLVRA